MFDFSNLGRKEGDYMTQGLSLNNKGLVTFDRKVRKDAFFFYKAQWNSEPMVYITARRYTNRSYPVTDVKVYSNAGKETSFWTTTTASSASQRCAIRTSARGKMWAWLRATTGSLSPVRLAPSELPTA
jgi:hypothetical protein